MILLITFLLLAAAMLPGVLQYRRETAQMRAGRLHSFGIDWLAPFLLVGFGYTFVMLCTRKGRSRTQGQFRRRKKLVNRSLWLFMTVFWCSMELPAYFNLIGHPFDPTKSGNEFMWNGYIEWLGLHLYNGPFPSYHYWWSWPVLIGLLAVQAGCLWFGRELGYLQAFATDTDRWPAPRAKKR